jgi:hypothetical protein
LIVIGASPLHERPGRTNLAARNGTSFTGFRAMIVPHTKGNDMRAEATVLNRAYEHAVAYLEGLDSRSVAATASLAELRARLNIPLEATATPAQTVIDDLVAATEGGHLGSAGGRFFAWVIGGALPSALAADWLASTWDVNAAMYACGPAAAVTEEIAGAGSRRYSTSRVRHHSPSPPGASWPI